MGRLGSSTRLQSGAGQSRSGVPYGKILRDITEISARYYVVYIHIFIVCGTVVALLSKTARKMLKMDVYSVYNFTRTQIRVLLPNVRHT